MSKSLSPALAGLALVASLTACSGGSESGTTAPSTTAPAPSATPTAGTPSTSPSAVPTTAAPSKPAQVTKPRTAAELTKALLVLKDLPSGFAVEPAGAADDETAPTMSSKDKRCAPLVKIMNAESAPGSKASAARSFAGGQDGPFIDESIDALGSAPAVAALQRSFKSAVAACRTITLRLPGEGSSPMRVAEVSAPEIGEHPFSVRFTATGGALEGLELTMVTAGVKDVVVALTFVAAAPEDVDGATDIAVGKASKVLAGGAGT